MFLGVDPSQRHTGLCLRGAGLLAFDEIKTEGMDMLSSARYIRQRFIAFVRQHNAENATYAIEKQLSVGGQSSSLQFFVQMNVLEAVRYLNPEPTLVFPLPIQLQSYVKKVQNVPSHKGREYVAFCKKQIGHPGRLSEHCVDAYYLTRLAEDVMARRWWYKLPESEAAVIPWRIENGTKP